MFIPTWKNAYVYAYVFGQSNTEWTHKGNELKQIQTCSASA